MGIFVHILSSRINVKKEIILGIVSALFLLLATTAAFASANGVSIKELINPSGPHIEEDNLKLNDASMPQ